MRTIYIDSEFKCHISNDGTMTAVETAFFDGKCQTFIEGYLFIPSGESWVRSDGIVFHGEMITPWKPYSELIQAQKTYEETLEKEKTFSQLEILDSRVTYVAMMTDNLYWEV